MKTVVVYLTDKNRTKMFKNYVSELFIDSAVKELQQHINSAKKNPFQYRFLDIDTIEIKTEIINN